MADQKISELQLVVATGVAATGIYVPLYTPMLAPANRRISAAEFFKTPKRIEVSDPTLAGTGEVMTLTTSYGTASLRVGTGGQFILGGDLAAVGSVSNVSDSSPLTLGLLSDVKLYRDASGVLALRYGPNAQSLKIYNHYTGTHNEFVTLRFLSGAAQLGTFQDGTGIARTLSILASGAERINVPATNSSAVTISSSNASTGEVLSLTSSFGTANLRVGGGGQFIVGGNVVFLGALGIQLDGSPFSMGTNSDLQLHRESNDILGQRRLTNPQNFRIYNTYVSASVNEYVNLGFSGNVAILNSIRSGSGIVRNLDLQASGVSRLTVPAASGSAVTITSYDLSQGNVLALTSPSGTAAIRVGAGGQLVLPGSIATVGGLSQVSNTVPLYLGLSSDVGFLRTASGLVQVTNIGTGLGSLQARYLYASGAPTITADAPALTVSQRWDNAGVNFNGMIFDFIPQNAGSSSKLVDFRVSGVSYTSISQFGDVSSSSFTVAGNSATMRTSQFKLRDTGQFVWTNSSSAIGTEDTGLARASSGVIRVTDGSSGTGSITVRNTNSTVYTITDGTGVDINPASGAIQVWTLGATRTPSANNFAAGQSVTLMIDDGSAFSVNWGTMGVSWLNSTPPALPTSGYGVVELWKVGSTIYGTSVGNVV